MALTNYKILCHGPGCSQVAEYKIASAWSDGLTGELKTYSLCCAACLDRSYAAACEKQAVCRLAEGESLDPPGIYQLVQGQRDVELKRLPLLERRRV